MYLAFISPHFPLQALPADIAKYQDRFTEGWDVARERRWKRATEMGLVNCALSPLQPGYVASWSLTEAQLQTQVDPGESGVAVAWNSLSEVQKKYQAMKMAIHAAMIDRMDQEAPALPGRSLVPAFAKDGAVAREFIYFNHQGNRALRVGDFKLVSAGTNGVWELYDLKPDRAEMNNLASSQPEKVKAMRELWEQKTAEYKQQAGEPRPEDLPAKKGGKAKAKQ